MANSATLQIEIQVDDKGAVKVKGLSHELDKTGKQGKKSFDEMGHSAQDFGKKTSSATSTVLKLGGAVVGLLALRAGYQKLNSAATEYIGLANIQEQAETRLGAVLKATGQASGYNLEQLKNMASAMQQVSTVGDEVTLAGMSILATFKQVRGEAFERASMAALDMAEVMGQDLKSSMVQLGKALNDPTVGLTALSRVGVTFTEQQKEQIKTLQESGRMMEAQAVILAELESEFGGAASAAIDRFGGAVQQASNALGDTKEEMGFVITKSQFFIDLIHQAQAEFEQWGRDIKENRQFLMELAKDGVLWVVDSLRIAIRTVEFFHGAWLGLKFAGAAAIKGLADVLNELLYPTIRALLYPLDLIYEGMVKIGALDVNPFESIQSSLAAFRDSTTVMTAEMREHIVNVSDGYNKAAWELETWRYKIEEIPVTQAEADAKVVASHASAQEQVAEIDKKAVAEAAKLQSQLTDEIKKMSLEEYEYKRWALEQEVAARRITALGQKEILDSLDEYERLSLAKIAKEQRTALEKAQADKLKTVNEFNLKHEQLVLGEHAFEKRQLEAQAQAYEDAGADRTKVHVWLYSELAKLDKEYAVGFARGLNELEDEYGDWGKNLGKLTEDTAHDLHESMSEGFLFLFEHDFRLTFDTLADVTDEFTKRVKRRIFDMAADIAAEKVIMYFTSAWDGDPSGKGTIESMLGIDVPFLSFAGGGPVPGVWNQQAGPAGDSVLAMLTPGEYVVPREIAQLPEIRQLLEAMRLNKDLLGTVPEMAAGGVVGLGLPHLWGGFGGLGHVFSSIASKVVEVVSTLGQAGVDVARTIGQGSTMYSGTDVGRILSLATSVALAIGTGGASIPAQLAAAGIGTGASLAFGGSFENSLGAGLFASQIAGLAYVGSGTTAVKVGDKWIDVPESQVTRLDNGRVILHTDTGDLIATLPRSDMSDAWSIASQGPKEFFDDIQQTGAQGFSKVKDFLSGDDMGSLAKEQWDALKSLPSSVWDYMSNLPIEVWDHLHNFNLPGYVVENLPNILSHLLLSMPRMSGGSSLDMATISESLGISRAHNGGYLGLRPDEGLIVAQDGEGVLNREAMKLIGQWNMGQVPSVPAAQSGPTNLYLTIVTESGDQLFNAVVKDLKNKSARGQIVLHAEGIAPARA